MQGTQRYTFKLAIHPLVLWSATLRSSVLLKSYGCNTPQSHWHHIRHNPHLTQAWRQLPRAHKAPRVPVGRVVR